MEGTFKTPSLCNHQSTVRTGEEVQWLIGGVLHGSDPQTCWARTGCVQYRVLYPSLLAKHLVPIIQHRAHTLHPFLKKPCCHRDMPSLSTPVSLHDALLRHNTHSDLNSFRQLHLLDTSARDHPVVLVSRKRTVHRDDLEDLHVVPHQLQATPPAVPAWAF